MLSPSKVSLQKFVGLGFLLQTVPPLSLSRLHSTRLALENRPQPHCILSLAPTPATANTEYKSMLAILRIATLALVFVLLSLSASSIQGLDATVAEVPNASIAGPHLRSRSLRARLNKRALPLPLSVSAAGSRVQWCCKERGRCRSQMCPRVKAKNGIFMYGGKYRVGMLSAEQDPSTFQRTSLTSVFFLVEDDCIIAFCRQVCFKTARSCDSYF